MLSTTTARMWAAAIDLARILRADLTTPTTVRKWKRAPRECPQWCARGHMCTAQHGYPNGQHRSEPVSIRTGYGALVATRVAGDTRNQIELRAIVVLPADETDAGIQADRVMTGVHLTITALSSETTSATIHADTVRTALPGQDRPALGEIGRAA